MLKFLMQMIQIIMPKKLLVSSKRDAKNWRRNKRLPLFNLIKIIIMILKI